MAVIESTPKRFSEIAVGMMAETIFGFTRIMAVTHEMGVTTVEFIHGGEESFGSHQTIKVMDLSR
jgi:hypothetical protein